MHKWIVLWVASLVVVVGLTSVLMRAQGPQIVPPPLGGQPPTGDRVVSGADLGFRVDTINRLGEPVGTFVVRMNGQWVPVKLTPDVRQAH